MSFLTTDKKIVGKFKVTNHARNRYKERYGEKRIGNKKIKNAGKHKIDRKITKKLRKNRYNYKEQKDNSLKVKTDQFNAIIKPGFHNIVVTILP